MRKSRISFRLSMGMKLRQPRSAWGVLALPGSPGTASSRWRRLKWTVTRQASVHGGTHTMKHIKLGDLDVARIGLGTMGMTGTYGADDLDDAESIRTIH